MNNMWLTNEVARLLSASFSSLKTEMERIKAEKEKVGTVY